MTFIIQNPEPRCIALGWHVLPRWGRTGMEQPLVSAVESFEADQQTVEQIRGCRDRIFAELSKVIIGQQDVAEQLLLCLFSGGHCLITGAPGLAKTLLVRSVAQIFHLKFQRIQFTPDLMPADITGTEILEETGDGHARCSSSRGRFLRT